MYVPPREASACSSGNKVSHSLVTQEDNAAFVIKDSDDSLVIKGGDDSLAPNILNSRCGQECHHKLSYTDPSKGSRRS